MNLYRNDFLPFTLTFFLRFSSGTCILYSTSVYTSGFLAFVFRDCEFRRVVGWASVYSSVSLPGPCVFENVGFGDFVMPQNTFDR